MSPFGFRPRLDTLVTVVDLVNFDDYFGSEEGLDDRFKDVPQEDERTVVQLLIDQVQPAQFCTVVAISTLDADLCSPPAPDRSNLPTSSC